MDAHQDGLGLCATKVSELELFLTAFQCHHAFIETKMLILKLRICIQAIPLSIIHESRTILVFETK